MTHAGVPVESHIELTLTLLFIIAFVAIAIRLGGPDDPKGG